MNGIAVDRDRTSIPLDKQVILGEALKIRLFEEVLLDLYKKGKVRGTVHTCIGQELISTSLAALLGATDTVFGTHRSHGHYLAITKDYEGLAREILGKSGGTSEGFGGSQHLIGSGIITNGVQGGLVPIAAGFSSAAGGGISIAVLGDGTLGEGVVYETLNLASLWELPVLFLMEDNGIAQSTPSEKTTAGTIEGRATAFGISYSQVTTDNLDNFCEGLVGAIERVRKFGQPHFLRVQTNRLAPHSKGDDNRDPNIISALWERDTLSRWVEGSPAGQAALENEKQAIHNLFETVLEAPDATAVMDTRSWRESVSEISGLRSRPTPAYPTIREEITASIACVLEKNPDALFVGEDIEYRPQEGWRSYRGAFGVSSNLSERFPQQVRGAPISEQAIVGFAIGRALAGSPTIVEIMFGDFMTLIVDQVTQQAAKIPQIYGRHVGLPLLVRSPVGGSRGYGPTHSQHTETAFLGLSNINIYVVSPFGVSDALFGSLMSSGFPTIVYEGKDLYALDGEPELHPAYQRNPRKSIKEPIQITPKRAAAEITILTYGEAAAHVIRTLGKLVVEMEIFCDVFVLELIQPCASASVQESLLVTSRLLVIEDVPAAKGLLPSVLQTIFEDNADASFKVGSVSGHGEIGASAASETAAKISPEKIIAGVLQMLGRSV
jgi:2-oxoisovalerate dehydrogenase E1 component